MERIIDGCRSACDGAIVISSPPRPPPGAPPVLAEAGLRSVGSPDATSRSVVGG
jgi:hypothetical protein